MCAVKTLVMADAAAKREARRRRILENSEYRLQKITGQVNHNHPTGKTHDLAKSQATHSCIIPGLFTNKS